MQDVERLRIMPDDVIVVDVPRKIVHRKEEEMKITDKGYRFAWIDVSAIVGLENYGFYFPDWLIKEKLEYCILNIQQKYCPVGLAEKDNVITVEHKEKIRGKKFKQFKYSALEIAEILHNEYDSKIQKKKAENQKVFAYVEEAFTAFDTFGFYCIGYINGKMFYSDEIAKFRYEHTGTNRNGGKQIDAKSCNIIAENLSQDDIVEIMKIMTALNITKEEQNRLCKRGFYVLPYPYFNDIKSWRVAPVDEYTIHTWKKGKDNYTTVSGYLEKLENLEKAYTDAVDFLEQRKKELTDMLDNWGNKIADTIH